MNKGKTPDQGIIPEVYYKTDIVRKMMASPKPVNPQCG